MSGCKHECSTCVMVEYGLDINRCGHTGKQISSKDTCDLWEPNNENLIVILLREKANLRAKLEAKQNEIMAIEKNTDYLADRCKELEAILADI